MSNSNNLTWADIAKSPKNVNDELKRPEQDESKIREVSVAQLLDGDEAVKQTDNADELKRPEQDESKIREVSVAQLLEAVKQTDNADCDSCVICLEILDTGSEYIIYPPCECKKGLHYGCYIRLVKPECPSCRGPAPFEEIKDDEEDNYDFEDYEEGNNDFEDDEEDNYDFDREDEVHCILLRRQPCVIYFSRSFSEFYYLTDSGCEVFVSDAQYRSFYTCERNLFGYIDEYQLRLAICSGSDCYCHDFFIKRERDSERKILRKIKILRERRRIK